MKRIFLILFCMFLLVGTVSAFEFDNVLNYEESDMKVTFINAFNIPLFRSDLGIAELKSHKTVDEVLKFGYGKEEVVMYYDFEGWELYENGLGEVIFTDERTGKIIKKDYYFVEWKGGEWIRYNSNDIPNRNIRIGLKTYVGRNDYIDGVWTIAGKEVERHAKWLSNLNVGLVFGYDFETLTGNNAIDVVGYSKNITTSSTNLDASGVSGNAWDLSGSKNGQVPSNWVDIDGSQGFTFSMWIKTSQATTGQLFFFTNPAWNTQFVDDGGLRLSKFFTTNYLDVTPTLNNGSWHNLLAVVTPTTTEVYFDGTGIASRGSISYDFTSLGTRYIGTQSGSESYTGSIDEMYFWNRTLSTEEIIDVRSGITYDPTPPKIILNVPLNNTVFLPVEITFNCTTLNEANLVNLSLILDGVVNETNSSGIGNSDYIFTKILPEGNYNWTCEGCDSGDFCLDEVARSLTIAPLVEEETFYNPITYETSEETFTINITTNGTLTTSAIFFYNGVSQGASTKTGTDANANFSNTIQIPAATGNKTFLWQLTVGATESNSTAINQTVGPVLFGLCNATLTVPYINFTFVDEETSLDMNATIDASTWSYWLGDGTYTKTLLYSNNTLNDFYGFCLVPGNVTLYNTRSVQYAAPGYPQRKYDASSDLTNSTTNKTLYLLSSSDGIYSTIQVVDTNSNQLTGVEVTAERQFAGLWTVVGEETTDSAGAVTFWVNPDYDHRFTFVKDGCTGTTVTIRPTQTQYTQQLLCGDTSSDYTATIEGIKYARTPTVGILQAGTHNFTYYLVSSKDNIINASFYLVNASDQTVLNSSVSSCTSSGCLLYLMHVVNSGDSIKGKYYVDVGNGSILLEGDAWWRSVDIPTAGKAGVATFFQDVIYIFQEWGDDTDTADFNRLVVIFFFMCIGIAVLNYHFNMDSMNPGMFLTILTFFVVMGSIIGGFSPTVASHGLFYYNNLSTNEYINNYLLAGIMMIISFASFLNVNRQGQR